MGEGSGDGDGETGEGVHRTKGQAPRRGVVDRWKDGVSNRAARRGPCAGGKKAEGWLKNWNPSRGGEGRALEKDSDQKQIHRRPMAR